MPSPRIAIGGILTECNDFGGMPIDLGWFERYELLRGEQLLSAESGVLGGMVSTLQGHRAGIVPLLFASTCPGGYVTADCYAQLKGELLTRLKQAERVNGVLLPLHGAMTVDGVWDPEGDLAAAVREIVGPGIPIIMTLDLHAQVTSAMVRNTSALVAWETYPHRDAFSTGQRATDLILRAAANEIQPTTTMARVPVITSAINASTEDNGPFAQIMRMAKKMEREHRVLSTSVFLGHPYVDLPEMGSGGLVVTDGDRELSEGLAREIANEYWNRRAELEPKAVSPEAAVKAGIPEGGGPVLLVEAADCCGGGAAGDSVAVLRALIQHAPQQSALVPVVDAKAAAQCHAAGLGQDLCIPLGHQHDPQWGTAVQFEGRVKRLGDGKFHYGGGIWDGIEGNMGPCAVLQCAAIQVLVTTYATYDWADEQFLAMGLDPEKADFVVAKNPMNYRNVFEKMAKAVRFLDTPGPTPVTLRHAPFRRLKHPFFPAHPDRCCGEPIIMRSWEQSANGHQH